jgi:predicted ferric reductase
MMTTIASEEIAQLCSLNHTQYLSSHCQGDVNRTLFEDVNEAIGRYYLWSLLVTAAHTFIFTSIFRLNRHIRHLACMNRKDQRYFTVAVPIINWCKHNIIYAPLLFHRRASETRLSQNFTLGNLPTRLQAVFILSLIGVNVFLATWKIQWHGPEEQVLSILRNRTGTLSTTNLIPILVTATVQNPFIALLGISYDSFNLIHRWIGRVAVLQAVVHSICWLIPQVQANNWATARESLIHRSFIRHGFIAVIGFMALFLQSPKLIRSWAYDIFLGLHFVFVIATFYFLWIHLSGFRQQKLLLVTIVIWGFARVCRLASLLFRSVGRSCCTAVIEVLPCNALRISLTPSASWTYHPGQFIYLVVPSIGLWTAHPFSVAWEDSKEFMNRFDPAQSQYYARRLSVSMATSARTDQRSQTISLIVQKQKGFTRKLYDSTKQAGVNCSLMAFIEGPYGVRQSLASYGTVVLFAGGVGITHQLGHIKNLIRECNDGTTATMTITLIWVVRHLNCLEWVKPWMHEILKMEKRREILKIHLYVTRSGLSQPVQSVSGTVSMSSGRPDVRALIIDEANNRIGCMVVSVCATGGLADEVRRVSRMILSKGVNLDFIDVGFIS